MCVGRIYLVRLLEGLQRNMTRASDIDPTSLLPLTPVAFDILLALLAGEAHGYAIMRSVRERAGGQTGLPAGTLYRALSRLVDTGLIEETEDPPRATADERRRYYAVTKTGRQVASAEAHRLESLLGTARAHGLLQQS